MLRPQIPVSLSLSLCDPVVIEISIYVASLVFMYWGSFMFIIKTMLQPGVDNSFFFFLIVMIVVMTFHGSKHSFIFENYIGYWMVMVGCIQYCLWDGLDSELMFFSCAFRRQLLSKFCFDQCDRVLILHCKLKQPVQAPGSALHQLPLNITFALSQFRCAFQIKDSQFAVNSLHY